MKYKVNFFGSTIAIIFGFLYFGSGVNSLDQQTGASLYGLIFGPVVILGALAYKSIKKRKLSLVPSSKVRLLLEIIAITLVLMSFLLHNNIKEFMAENPVVFIIWLWSFIPYLTMIKK